MRVAILIFDRITALDAIGPYEVLSRLPDAEVVFVSEHAGMKRSDRGSLGLHADRSIDEVTAADILVVPGGPGAREDVVKNPRVLEWVRDIDRGTTWTTSVCTGAIVLGAAGLLRGLDATTHWAHLERLRDYGANPVSRRVVEQGKIITAAGVSSGIDMALRLAQIVAGDRVAQSLQLWIEYDPAPPFDSGSPAKASAETIRLTRSMMTPR